MIRVVVVAAILFVGCRWDPLPEPADAGGRCIELPDVDAPRLRAGGGHPTGNDVGYMPQDGPLLCCQKLQAVERWITAGASAN